MLHLLWTPNVNLRFSFYSWLQASNNSNWNLVTCQPALIFREFHEFHLPPEYPWIFVKRQDLLRSAGHEDQRWICRVPANKAAKRGGPSLRRSQLSWPGKRMEQVMPDNPALTKWFKSPWSPSLLFEKYKRRTCPTAHLDGQFFIDFGSRLLIKNSY